MDFTFLFCATFIFLILESERTVAQCKPKRKEFDLEFPGLALNGKMLGSSNTEQIICQYSCHSHQNCDVYNYNSDDGRCEVLDARSSSLDVLKRPGWTFRAQKCEASPCHNEGTCFHALGKDRCLCPCQWKGEFCKVHTSISYGAMFFPGSVNDIVIYENAFPASLSQVTVSVWLQLDPNKAVSQYDTIFCYALPSKSDIIGVMLNPDLTEISINFNWRQFQDPSRWRSDNCWHHFLFTWENISGKLILYIDGVKRGEKNNQFQGETISQGGALVLGQDQDGYLRNYQASQSFKGNITSFNMWDRVLTDSEISDLAASPTSTKEGNFLKWSQLRSLPRSGNVQLL